MRITMLMPSLPPATCGIADHSVMLGQALKALGAEVAFLAPCAGAANGPRLWDGTAKGLRRQLRDDGCDVLWVQYSGYGYSSRGAPFGLARAVERVRIGRAARAVVVCMHETHASRVSLGWRAPVIQPLQIRAAGRIARTADVVFATVDANVERCVREYAAPRASVQLLPIASNIPTVEIDPGERKEFRKRLGLENTARIAVIFGLWSTQLRSLSMFMDDLERALRGKRIEHVVAIGGDTRSCRSSELVNKAHRPNGWLNGRLSVLGPAPGEEIARILRCCDIGLSPTPPEYLGKSGVIAAYAAAGLEVWLMDDSGVLKVESNPSRFPDWPQIAQTALSAMQSCLDGVDHDVG